MNNQAEFLDTKYNELKNLYLDFISKTEYNNVEKTNFVNEAYNCLNVMNKVISLAANGIAAEEQVSLSTNNEKPLPEKTEIPEVLKNSETREALENVVDNMTETVETMKEEIEDETKIQEAMEKGREFEELLKKIDTMTEEEVVAYELDRYGLSKRLAGYKDLLNIRKAMELSDWKLNKKSDDKEVFIYLSQANNITESQLYKNIETLIAKADFSKAMIIPLFKTATERGDTISVAGFLKEFIELFEADAEEDQKEE